MSAKRPLVFIGRNSRKQAHWDARVKLVERLGAVVLTDLKTASGFPTEHPAHVLAPGNQLNKDAREIVTKADVILSLDWIDLGGALKQSKSAGNVDAKVIAVSLDSLLHNGMHMDYQELPPAEVRVNACPEAMVAAINDALGAGKKKAPWMERKTPTFKKREQLHLTHIAEALHKAIGKDTEKVSFTGLARGWPIDLFPFRDPLAYMGKDGGGGIGSGPGISVGCALALSRMDRIPVGVLGDGDFAMGNNALWSAVHHKIPMLVILNNNRSYFNDELHQETVANARNRDKANRWVGQRMSDPDVDFATLVKGYGCIGIGPIKTVGEVAAAIEEGVAALRAGKVCVIDCWVDPTEERSAQSSLEVRL
jgi:thiamine pyrophosphate-dependent acetolactate synthase large subunit-like protein